MSENQLSFEAIRPYLIHQFQNESQLLAAVGEVGKLFNFYRENLDQYKKDEKLISAYCAYYLTTNYPKLFETLRLLGSRFNISSYDRVVDVGTGPGTFLLALAELTRPEVKLEGVDTSELMLKQAKSILDGLRPERDVKLGALAPSKAKGNTLLLFTHSLNEMGSGRGIEYAEGIDPQGILLIEPGTKDSFKKALELRQWAVDNGYNVAYPCFTNGRCPLDTEQDWCHQYVQVSHSLDVERMTQKLHRNRRLLPMVAQLYVKKEVAKSESARLVRVKKPTKHSLEWQLCSKFDGGNFVFDAEVPKRGMPKKMVKDLEDVMAGVEVEYSVDKELEGKKRIKLKHV